MPVLQTCCEVDAVLGLEPFLVRGGAGLLYAASGGPVFT